MKSTYALTLNTVTALHVGSGVTLERDFDFVTRNRETWVLNVDAIFDHLLDADSRRYERALAATPPGKLLEPTDFDPKSPLFHYVMRGVPVSTRTGAQLITHVKTVYNTPYLPGSSIKGALRTVVARAVWEAEQQRLRRSDMGRNRSWAGQKIERTLLGKDPNHDLLRALHVSDTAPVPAQHLVVHHARVFTGDHADSPIALECIERAIDLTATLTLDEFLLKSAANKLGWQHTDLLRQLPALANAQARRRIANEQAYYAEHHPNSRVAKLYAALARLLNQLAANQFLLQVGWGGGYTSKTITPSMSDAERRAIVETYRLSKNGRASVADFPISRRTLAANQQPYAPLGWLLVEMGG